MKLFKRLICNIANFYILLFILIIIFSLFTVTTEPNEYTVIRQFGEVVRINENESGKNGLSFKIPFIQGTSSIPNTVLMYDLPISNVITSDKKTMISDCFALYQISDPILYIRTLNQSISSAESRIDVNVYNGLNNTISNTLQQDVISGRNGALVQSIMINIGNDLNTYGIELLSVETKKLDLPDSNKESVFTRMITEREKIAVEYTANGSKEAQEIRNEADREASITISIAKKEADQIKAEGEAQYMSIISAAYDSPEKAEFYNFVRALDAAKLALTEGDVLYLDEDSPLASIFKTIN